MFTSLRAALINDAGVSAIISDRVYPGIIPDGADLPAISTFSEGVNKSTPIDGEAGIYGQTWQINCVAYSSKDVSALADAVENALDWGQFPGISFSIVHNRHDDPPGIQAFRRTIIEVQLTRD